jgi:hypothetical protein
MRRRLGAAPAHIRTRTEPYTATVTANYPTHTVSYLEEADSLPELRAKVERMLRRAEAEFGAGGEGDA